MAIAEVEQALALDPEFKEAWVLDSHIRASPLSVTDPEHVDEHRPRGEQAARRALELDPELGDAYAALGAIVAGEKGLEGRRSSLSPRPCSLNVPSADMGAYAILQLYAGKFSPFARDIFEEARAADAAELSLHRFLAFAHAGLGEWARANELYESGIRRVRSR